MHRVIHRADHELTAGKVLLELGLALVVLSIRRYDGQDFLGVIAKGLSAQIWTCQPNSTDATLLVAE